MSREYKPSPVPQVAVRFPSDKDKIIYWALRVVEMITCIHIIAKTNYEDGV